MLFALSAASAEGLLHYRSFCSSTDHVVTMFVASRGLTIVILLIVTEMRRVIRHVRGVLCTSSTFINDASLSTTPGSYFGIYRFFYS